MKSAIRRTYGPPEHIAIEDIARPIPTANEILVQVVATTVNRTDCANLTAKPFIMRFVLGFWKPKRPILGTDFAGIVVETGSEVKGFDKGDRVFGFNDTGTESQAEFLCINPVGKTLHIPESIDFRTAAASLEGAHYAYTFIQKANLQPGEKVLINGATGAIGSALLQFVRMYDVHITATSNTKNTDHIRRLGADRVYDYSKEDFTRDAESYDFIFDAVGKSTFFRCRHLLTERGTYISSELGPWCQNIFLALLTPWLSKRKVRFPIPYSTSVTLPFIHEQLEKGIFEPVIDRSYVLNDIRSAYTYVRTGEKTGNVIIDVKA